MTENSTLSVYGVLAVHESQLSARAVWRRGCVIPTFCDFKTLRFQKPKMRTFCESRILGFDDSMILNGAAGKSCNHLPC